MKQFIKLIGVLSILSLISVFAGCGYLGGEEGEPYVAFYDEPYEDACKATPAAPYEIAPVIGVEVGSSGLDEEGNLSFRKLASGDYIEPDTKIPLRIKVSPRLDGSDEPIDQRVFVGNCGDFYTEALLDENGEYYVCDYVFEDKYLTFPLLIKVLYPEGYAAKSKIVVTTRQGDMPEAGNLVKKGLGVVLSDELAQSLAPAVGALVGDMDVKEFKPADNSTGFKNGVLSLNIMDLVYSDMVLSDTDADGVRGINISLEDTRVTKIPGFDIMVGWIIENLLKISMGAKAIDLGDMLQGLGNSGDGEESLLASILQNLELDSLLFLNIAGVPEQTTSDFAAIGIGLYATDSGSVIQTGVDEEGEPVYLWPEVIVDEKDTLIDWEELKTYKTADNDTKHTDLGVAMTEYNMNHLLRGMMQNLYLVLEGDIISTLAGFVAKVSPSSIITLGLAINPDGIAMDLNPDEQSVGMLLSDPNFHPGGKALFTVSDVRAELMENGTPVTLLSVDLTMEMGISINATSTDDLNLVIELLPIVDLSHVHVMKDSKGLGIADNSGLVEMLFSTLGGGEIGEPYVLEISLSGQGMKPIADFENTGGIKFDGLGNCFMNLALSDLDTSGFCFISTAAF